MKLFLNLVLWMTTIVLCVGIANAATIGYYGVGGSEDTAIDLACSGPYTLSSTINVTKMAWYGNADGVNEYSNIGLYSNSSSTNYPNTRLINKTISHGTSTSEAWWTATMSSNSITAQKVWVCMVCSVGNCDMYYRTNATYNGYENTTYTTLPSTFPAGASLRSQRQYSMYFNYTTIVSNVAPTITVSYPTVNGTSTISNSQVIGCTGIDQNNATFRIRIFVNNTLRATNSSARNNTQWSYNVSGLTQGSSYTSKCEAYDGTYAVNSSIRTFRLNSSISSNGTIVFPKAPMNDILRLKFNECTGSTVYDLSTSDSVKQNFSKQNEAFFNSTSTPNGHGCSGGVDGVNDYFQDVTSTGLNFLQTKNFTITMDLYVYNYRTAGGPFMFFEGNGGLHRAWILSDGNSTNKMRFSAMNSASSTTTQTFPTGQWFSLGFVFDNTNNKYLIYYNGTNIQNFTSRTNDDNATLIDTRVGESYGNPPRFLVDNVRVYHRALNSSDIYNTHLEDFNLSISGGGSSSSCTYSGSGNWVIDLDDYYNTTSAVNVGSYNITLRGIGRWYINSTVTAKTLNNLSYNNQYIKFTHNSGYLKLTG